MTWLAFWNRSVRTAPAAGGGNQSWRQQTRRFHAECCDVIAGNGVRRKALAEALEWRGLTVVSLNGKDAGRVGEVRLVGDQCCRALRSACMHGVTERPLKLPVMLATSLMQFCISALPD